MERKRKRGNRETGAPRISRGSGNGLPRGVKCQVLRGKKGGEGKNKIGNKEGNKIGNKKGGFKKRE